MFRSWSRFQIDNVNSLNAVQDINGIDLDCSGLLTTLGRGASGIAGFAFIWRNGNWNRAEAGASSLCKRLRVDVWLGARERAGTILGTREAEDLDKCTRRSASPFTTTVAVYFAFIGLRLAEGTSSWLRDAVVMNYGGRSGIGALQERNGERQVGNNYGHARFANVPSRKVEICLDDGEDAVEEGDGNLKTVRRLLTDMDTKLRSEI